MTIKNKLLEKGFTIAELAVYMGIFAVLAIVLTEIFVSTIGVQLESEANSSVQQDNRYLLSRLRYDISRATSVSIPASLGTSGSTLQLLISGVNYSYSLSGNNLQLNAGGTIDQLNNWNTKITNLNFTRLGNPGGREDTITINLTLSSLVQKRTTSESASFKTTVALRRN